jgi:hypothetical protein
VNVHRAIFVAAALALTAATNAEPISSDRPGFSSAPVTIETSVWQLEAGYLYTRDNREDLQQHTLPQFVLRYGLTDVAELQLGWAGYTRGDIGGQDIDGSGDISVGFKWRLSEPRSPLALALYTGVSLPSGSARLSSGNVVPTLGLLWSHDSVLPLFGTALVASDDGDLSLGNSLGINLPVSDSIGAYLEYFSQFAEGTGPEHYINGGFTWLRQSNLQLDLYLGSGLNSRAADFFGGIGAAYRFR